MNQAFGEYLVSKKLISPEALVQAYITQQEQYPCISKLAYQHKIFTEEEMIKIFTLQSKTQSTFISSCNALGLLSSEKLQILEKEMSKYHQSIPNILLKNNIISIENLVSSLDEYLSNTNISAPLFNPTGLVIQKNYLNDLKSLLSSNNLSIIYSELRLIKENSNNIHKLKIHLKELQKNIISIKGFAKLIQTTIIEVLCTWLEKAISKVLNQNSQIPSDDIINLTKSIEQVLSYCILTIENIELNESETQIAKKLNSDSVLHELKLRLGA